MPYRCEANKIIFTAKHNNKFKERHLENTKDIQNAVRNISGYHPEIEPTCDIDVPAIAMRHGHQGTFSGNVAAMICPKA